MEKRSMLDLHRMAEREELPALCSIQAKSDFLLRKSIKCHRGKCPSAFISPPLWKESPSVEIDAGCKTGRGTGGIRTLGNISATFP